MNDEYLIITNACEIIHVIIIFTSPTYIMHLLPLLLIVFVII